MKLYNTRKPRCARFNAFPPKLPRWSWHRRRCRCCHRRSEISVRCWQTPADAPIDCNGSLCDGWWKSEGERPRNTSLASFLFICGILPIHTFFLFASIFCIYIAVPVHFAASTIWSYLVALHNYLWDVAADLFTPKPPPMDFFHQRYCTPLHKFFYVLWHR